MYRRSLSPHTHTHTHTASPHGPRPTRHTPPAACWSARCFVCFGFLFFSFFFSIRRPSIFKCRACPRPSALLDYWRARALLLRGVVFVAVAVPLILSCCLLCLPLSVSVWPGVSLCFVASSVSSLLASDPSGPLHSFSFDWPQQLLLDILDLYSSLLIIACRPTVKPAD